MAKQVKIKIGPVARTVEVPDGVNTLDELRGHLGRYNVTAEHSAYLTAEDGGKVSEAAGNQVLEEGQTFEFSRNTGQKG